MKFNQLISTLRELDDTLKRRVIKVVNIGLSARNWLVGAYLVEFEQDGENRAAYGKLLLPKIANDLKVKGLSVRNLEACRLFYQAYPGIPQSLTAEFAILLPEISQSATAESRLGKLLIQQTLSGELPPGSKSQAASDFSKRPDFALPVAELVKKLTFTHFVELLRINDPLQRAFYEMEYALGGMDKNLFVSSYQVALPSKEELESFIIQHS